MPNKKEKKIKSLFLGLYDVIPINTQKINLKDKLPFCNFLEIQNGDEMDSRILQLNDQDV